MVGDDGKGDTAIMYLDINKHPEARNYRVFNLDNGNEIPRVIWADDTRGRFRQHRVSKNGRLLADWKRGRIRTILHTGRNIELRKVT